MKIIDSHCHLDRVDLSALVGVKQALGDEHPNTKKTAENLAKAQRGCP